MWAGRGHGFSACSKRMFEENKAPLMTTDVLFN
jgi:hypothetical protein